MAMTVEEIAAIEERHPQVFHRPAYKRFWPLLLIADTPAPGLSANEMPSVDSIPNNHLAYAVQWFLFAGVAVIIYLLALRRRARKG